MKPAIRTLVLSAAVIFTPASLAAQDIGETSAIAIAPDLDRSDVAGARVEPGFSPEPIVAGPFLLQPSLSVVGGFDTNVFDRPNELDDAVVLVTPSLKVRANTPRHLAEISVKGHFRRFWTYETENSEEFLVSGRTEFELAGTNRLFANALYGQQIESRSSAGTIVNTVEPVNFDLAMAQVGAELAFGNLWTRPRVSVRKTSFSDVDQIGGGTIDLAFRNQREFAGDLAVGYDVSGLFQVFAEGGLAKTESTSPAPNAARDADEFSLLAGVRGELSPLLVAELAAGYRKRDYDLARYRDYEGLTYRADVQWYATPLMTLQFQARQDFLNSGNAQVAGILSNRFSLTGYLDPLRNLRLSATAAYEHNRFRETDTRAERPSLRAQVEYRLSPNISVGTFAALRRQEVSGTPIVPDFTSFSAGIGVTLNP